MRIGCFYSNPQRLIVKWNKKYIRDLNPSGYDFGNVQRPTVEMPCGTNTYVGWENKLYFVVCGANAGDDGLTIHTLPVIRLAITSTQLVDVGMDQFYDEPGNLATNIVALFGIPRFRIRTVSVVPDSADTGFGALGRRLQATHPLDANATYDVNHTALALLRATRTKTTTLEINTPHPCDDLQCGFGFCELSDAGDAYCVCERGWSSPSDCEEGDCKCSLQKCHADCLYCTGMQPTDCTACSERSTKPFLQPDGSCGSVCAVGSFKNDSGACQPCTSVTGEHTCMACSGPGDSDCTECSLARGLPYLDAGRCVGACPNGTWPNSRRECVPCDASCKTCDGPGSLSCLSCFPHKCATSVCPPAFKPLHEVSSCRSRCSAGHYQDGAACLPCDPACRECNGPTVSQCIDPSPQTPFTSADCGDGASRSHGLCALDCPEYTFLDPSGRCSSCDLTCARCAGPSNTQCLKCHPHLADSAALHDGVCVRRCPEGMFRDLDSSCRACAGECATCVGPAKTDCASCSAAHPFKLLGGCHAACPQGFAADFERRCVQCDETCKTCDAAANATRCTGCHEGSALPVLESKPEGGVCVATCPNGTYAAAGGVCAACDASCLKCNGPSAANCTDCAPPLIAVQGVCSALKSSSATAGLKLRSEGEAFNEMVALRDAIAQSAGNYYVVSQ